MNNMDWRSFVDMYGDFEFPQYLYKTNQELMKYVLDMGTLLSEDTKKLRAYREQVKKAFRDRWMNIVDALEFFDMVVPCQCDPSEYCKLCSGARFVANINLTPDVMREMAIVTGADASAGLEEKLQQGLRKAMREVGLLVSVAENAE